jgi:hypothetical protein
MQQIGKDDKGRMLVRLVCGYEQGALRRLRESGLSSSLEVDYVYCNVVLTIEYFSTNERAFLGNNVCLSVLLEKETVIQRVPGTNQNRKLAKHKKDDAKWFATRLGCTTDCTADVEFQRDGMLEASFFSHELVEDRCCCGFIGSGTCSK